MASTRSLTMSVETYRALSERARADDRTMAAEIRHLLKSTGGEEAKETDEGYRG